MSAPKRDHLIETAQSLFAREGFKGVAVDRLIAEAGVAKMTLYKGFRTKDELILETLKRRDTHLRNWFMREVTAATTGPEDRLLTCFDVLEIWCDRPDFNGCYFVSALTEYSDEAHPAHRAAKEHKRLMLDHIIDLCKATDIADPEDLARDLRLLMEGATVSKLTLNDVGAFQRAKRMAVLIIPDTQSEHH
ncbi:MAG: TetR family transcriptional regulator [Rhodobiaceae bacterium]|nr:TetR family transcriptional regulator [Rhodobiaceae bacterium]